MTKSDSTPLIMHIVHRFGIGGLENGVVNLLNKLPPQFARHCVMALTTVDPAFRERVRDQTVEFVEINKPEGQTFKVLPSVFREIRLRKPAIVHSRNIAALECQVAAAMARVPIRIHGEHGWDVNDLHGSNASYRRVRRVMSWFTHHQIALSKRTHDYLHNEVGIPARKITQICNGVDTVRFGPLADSAIADWPFNNQAFVFGTVGRLAAVKNQRLLVEAFISLRDKNPRFREQARLLIVGGGPDYDMLQTMLRSANAQDACWLTGDRPEVPDLLRRMDLFCLPSLAEGISNSILEAMACALPVVATDVGGNSELVQNGVTGLVVGGLSVAAFADCIEKYFEDRSLLSNHSSAARIRAVEHFSLETMVSKYYDVYKKQLSVARIESTITTTAV